MYYGDSAKIIHAFGHIARAHGMAKLAKKTGLGRESLYKTLCSVGAKPRFDAILKVIWALGLPHVSTQRQKNIY